MTKRIIQIVLAVVIVCLIYVIYKQISTPIIFAKEKAAREARVIDRIKDIRTAERSFKTKYNRFTGDFDTLINFVLTDSLEFERKIVDEDDSVAMAQLKKSGRKNSEKVWVHGSTRSSRRKSSPQNRFATCVTCPARTTRRNSNWKQVL